ncbi:MAG: serine/threonine-protein kinase [Woeseiaceae bacterium]|nr:serine/threonine-protein kinase [Woeseiaceae bacterium]
MAEKKNKPEPELPAQIADFKILDVLGEGGMAIVYLAEQLEPVKRRVALKILKPGMDSKQIVARFESERQALAVLDHPNIAKVFDGGMTEMGRPYFAMELVKGPPITEYCDSNHLSVEGRLELFLSVCSAVQHAHHKGLIHRDLKPSNLLVAVVDGKPQVKVIDFGIAKATAITLTEETLYTRVGQLVGTPQYMSPEQADFSGLDVDTRADVYSLGVVLYELLVGVVPLDLTAIGEQALRTTLREKDVPKPSTRIVQLGDTNTEIAKARSTDVRELRKRLSGDLDWVVMRAIEKDRTRRYETVNALAMECRRFLAHEPVLARPPSAGYLLRRFARRNRVAVLAGSVAMLAVLAGGIAATVGFVQASAAEKRAVAEAAKARQIAQFMVDLFEVSDPSEARGNSITAREILDRGADMIQVELAAQPVVQSALMSTIGSVYTSLGLYEPAQGLLDMAQEQTVSLHGEASVEAARVFYELARLARLRDDSDQAIEYAERSLALRRDLLGPEHDETIDSVSLLGVVYYFGVRYEEAENVLREAEQLAIGKYGEDSAETADIRSTLGSVLHNTAREDEAAEVFRAALEVHRNLYGENHPLVASNLNDLALSVGDSGDLEQAKVLLEQSLASYTAVYPDGHPFRWETQAHLAGVYGSLGDVARAEQTFKEAIDGLEATVGTDHMLTLRAKDGYGVMLFSNRRLSEAEPLLLETVRLHKALLGERHINTGRAMNNLAALLFLSGKYEESEQYFRGSLSIRLEELGEDNPDVANSRNNLADLLNRLDRHVEAEPLARAAAESYATNYAETHWRAAVARNVLGASLAGQGRLDEAEDLLIPSLEILADARGGSIYHRMALERTISLFDAKGDSVNAANYQKQLNCIQEDGACQ